VANGVRHFYLLGFLSVVKMVDRAGRVARAACLAAVGIGLVPACGGESRLTLNDADRPGAGMSGSSALGGTGGADAGAGGSLGGGAGGSLGGGAGGSLGGGAGSAGGGDGTADVPLFEGIPSGDCEEPAQEVHAMLGCPANPPKENAACGLNQGVTCAYSLSASDGRTHQELFMCSNGPTRQWWSLAEVCGEICTDVGPHTLDLDASDCASRPTSACELPGTEFAYAPSAFTLLSNLLGNVIDQCAPNIVNFDAMLALENGCPTRLSTTYAFTPEALACLKAALETKRYSCGKSVPCTQNSKYLAI
jgi:hypothetical protein